MIDLWITQARYLGAWIRTRGVDTAPVARYASRGPGDVFYIVGPGGTVNDLTETDIAAIEAGTCASINMAVLAPIAFDICALELVAHAAHHAAIAAKLRGQAKPALIWFQNRRKHETAHLRELEAEFAVFRYTRVSVSVRKRLAVFETIWARFIAPRVLGAPDLALSFAVTGSVARLVLLGLALGYRRIGFVGVDLGATPYFWLEDRRLRDQPRWVDASGVYAGVSSGAATQGGGTPAGGTLGAAPVVPNIPQFLAAVRRSCPGVDLFTLDRAGRSNLTPHLLPPMPLPSAVG